MISTETCRGRTGGQQGQRCSETVQSFVCLEYTIIILDLIHKIHPCTNTVLYLSTLAHSVGERAGSHSLTHHNTVVRTITHFTLLGNIYLYTLVEISRDGASSKSSKVPVCRHVCTLRPCDDDAMGGWTMPVCSSLSTLPCGRPCLARDDGRLKHQDVGHFIREHIFLLVNDRAN